jgi:nucleoside 2-deoxyribosyltransferase
MPRCVVIQPFDNGDFDHRYDDVLVPAIKAAGFEPYRVDRDASAVVLIDSIEANIKDADICLADISEKNPNVWYEVGFALASSKEVVLICKEGSEFPFDVRHRAIIPYTTGSKRNLAKLETDIAAQLAARARKKTVMAKVSSLKPVHGLSNPEMLALALIVEGRVTPHRGETPSSIADDMEKQGITRFASALALEGLLQKEYIEVIMIQGYNEEYEGYKSTKAGMKWCMENQAKFASKIDVPVKTPAPRAPDDEEEDDIPF